MRTDDDARANPQYGDLLSRDGRARLVQGLDSCKAVYYSLLTGARIGPMRVVPIGVWRRWAMRARVLIVGQPPGSAAQ